MLVPERILQARHFTNRSKVNVEISASRMRFNCPVSTADICPVSAEDICPVSANIVCVSETGQGPDTCNRDGSRQPYTDFSNRTHPTRQNRGAVPMGIAVWRVTEKPKENKMAMGSICQIMDKAQNRGKLSEMGPEWSPGPEKKAPSFQPCLAVDCARSRGQEGPPEASSGRN